jgi:hypothetical protein
VRLSGTKRTRGRRVNVDDGDAPEARQIAEHFAPISPNKEISFHLQRFVVEFKE